MKQIVTLLLSGMLLSTGVYAQLEVDQAIELNGADGTRAVRNLEAPVNGTDAANKDYVDNAASASGGGGGLPSMISNESGTELTFVDAVAYCADLTEGDHTDWRMPTLTEALYFARSTMPTNYVWTISETPGLDYPINQNYISVRLSDGKWRNGGATTVLFPNKNISGSTLASSWTTVGTVSASAPTNTFLPTHIRLQGRSGSCCPTTYFRLVYNLPGGTSIFSSEYTATSASTVATFIDMQSIPLLNGGTPLSSIDVQAYTSSPTISAVVTLLSVAGYESAFNQLDGNTLYTRCVR